METNESASAALSTRSVGVSHAPVHAMTVGELAHALSRIFPLEGGEPWDRSGLLVGASKEPVKGVAVALDATPMAINVAAEQGANVLLTHHPVFLEPPTRICDDIREAGLSGSSVSAAISANVALMNFHTCLDVTARAACVLPSLLSLDFSHTYVQPSEAFEGSGYGALCTVGAGDSLKTLEQLAARCTSVFGRPPRVWGALNERITSIACAGGSVGFLLKPAIAAGVDVLVCGEVHYHDALEAQAAGLSIIELGHDVSEQPLAVVLIEACTEAGIARNDIFAIDQSGHWTYPDAVRL